MPTLRWLTRDQDVQAAEKVPYRLLQEVPTLGYGDRDTGNMLIQGDNLAALKSLLPFYAGRVKCIYIDPPYNTGSAFEHYDDNLEHSQWLAMMWPRLELLRELLSEDGSIFVQLDDKEAHYFKVLLDEVFGRKNFINSIVISTNKPFGFKGTSGGLFKQANFLFFYAKDKAKLQINERALYIERSYDTQYKWVFDDMSLPESEWTWSPITELVAKENGFESARVAKKSVGDSFESSVAKFAIENARRVFRTAAVSGGALAKRRSTIESSYRRPNVIVRHPNDDMDYQFIGGGRVLMYKERLQEIDGELLPAELITDIWADVSVEGLAAEGGVDFPKGKKPEKLVRRCIELVSRQGDLVLDSFLGSGTTAAVAQKMGRRFIGIEMGDHAVTHCQPRLAKVVDGEQGGISKAQNWQGGGGFRFYRLGAAVFDETGGLQQGIRFATLAAHIWFSEMAAPWNAPATVTPFLGAHGGRGVALLYNGILGDKSVSGGNVLNRQTLQVVRAAAGDFAGPITIYGERTVLSDATLQGEGVTFKQTPYDVRARK